MTADGVRRLADWFAAEPDGNQIPQRYTNVGASFANSAFIRTQSALEVLVARGRGREDTEAPIPRYG